MARRIDFHVHTEFSNDSNLKVEHILNKSIAENFYISITDHNEIGGYLKSQKLNGKNRVIPGIETTSIEGVHILLYFTTKKDLVNFYENIIKKNKTRDLYRLSIKALDIMNQGKKYGGKIGIPHPFTRTIGLLNSRIKNLKKHLKLVDFYEIYNGSLPDIVNR